MTRAHPATSAYLGEDLPEERYRYPTNRPTHEYSIGSRHGAGLVSNLEQPEGPTLPGQSLPGELPEDFDAVPPQFGDGGGQGTSAIEPQAEEDAWRKIMDRMSQQLGLPPEKVGDMNVSELLSRTWSMFPDLEREISITAQGMGVPPPWAGTEGTEVQAPPPPREPIQYIPDQSLPGRYRT